MMANHTITWPTSEWKHYLQNVENLASDTLIYIFLEYIRNSYAGRDLWRAPGPTSVDSKVLDQISLICVEMSVEYF